METVINTLISGLISGSLYAAMALGLTIIYGVSRVFNFGHGVIAIIGAYIIWWMLDVVGLSVVPSVLISMGFMFLFGVGMYQFAINPLLKKPNWEFSTVLFMLGAGILLENVILQIFGPRVKSIPPFVEGSLKLGFVKINWHELILIGIVLLSVILLILFFRYTLMGQAMRAVAQSIPGARVVGIDINKIYGYAFGLAFVVTGLSGILLGTKYYLNPHIGWEWMVKGFVITSFGGLGSTSGTVYAAIILGVVEALATLYFGAIWVWPIWFAMFMIVLLIRPQGIAGGRL